jgi:hypothetical protein
MPVPPFIAVGQSHSAWNDIGASDWLVRQLWASASVALHASLFGPNYLIQSQSGRPGVRMRRGEAMDDVRLLPPRKRRGCIIYSPKWTCLPCVRYHYRFQAKISYRLHCGKRMHGVAHLSNGSALRPRACPAPRELHAQGRQSVQGIFTSELHSQNIPEQSTVQSAK